MDKWDKLKLSIGKTRLEIKAELRTAERVGDRDSENYHRGRRSAIASIENYMNFLEGAELYETERK